MENACLFLYWGTTNGIAPQFRRFYLPCFCEINRWEIFKLNFTFNLFTYSWRRCDESWPWRVARRQSLKLQNATISRYLQLIFYYDMWNLSTFKICKTWGGVIWSFCKRDDERQPCHVLWQEQAFDTVKLSSFLANLLWRRLANMHADINILSFEPGL